MVVRHMYIRLNHDNKLLVYAGRSICMGITIKKMIFTRVLLLVLLYAINIINDVVAQPLHVNLEKNNGNLEFAIQLPNSDTIQVGLSFKLLTAASNVNNTEELQNDMQDGESNTSDASSTTTIATIMSTIDTANVKESEQRKIVTVEEAIEGFRQDLIKKEREIAGIIESKSIFYRHFKLEFDNDKELTIRCTYDSNYKKRSLSIQCYEYHEFQTERILSNGEVEYFMQYQENYKSDVEIVNLKSLKQTYEMDIQ